MRRGLSLLWLSLLLAGVCVTRASAQEPIVRITAVPEEVPVGESVALEVTVLVPTWFPRPPRYPAFEMANTITRLPPDSSYPTNERIGRDTWSGIVRTYEVYPLIGATYRLSDQTMTVTYTDPETYKPATVEVEVPEVEFRAVVPAGAEGLDPYVAGKRLTLECEIEGDTDSLEVGDALVVRYTAELDGLPAIFLPALVEPVEAPGVSMYPEQPSVEDGDFARRSEKLTLVFEAGGDFSVPAAEIRWWNTKTSAVETASVPAMTVSVAGPPVPSPVEEAPPAKPRWPAILVWAAVLAAILWALRRWGPRLQAHWDAYQDRRHRSEGYAFGKLRKALRGGDPRIADQALLTWLERIEPGMGAREFVQRYGDAKLRQQIEALDRLLYSTTAEPVKLRRLERSLVAARRRYAKGARSSRSFVLPPMNP